MSTAASSLLQLGHSWPLTSSAQLCPGRPCTSGCSTAAQQQWLGVGACLRVSCRCGDICSSATACVQPQLRQCHPTVKGPHLDDTLRTAPCHPERTGASMPGPRVSRLAGGSARGGLCGCRAVCHSMPSSPPARPAQHPDHLCPALRQQHPPPGQHHRLCPVRGLLRTLLPGACLQHRVRVRHRRVRHRHRDQGIGGGAVV
mmetsp:Transcript_21422/g.36543  ORF Transcript_21422/g.36543 Transcript_21422/m.36543 type:complete len:201 (-) Transcript_21422:2185-2787(-)